MGRPKVIKLDRDPPVLYRKYIWPREIRHHPHPHGTVRHGNYVNDNRPHFHASVPTRLNRPRHPPRYNGKLLNYNSDLLDQKEPIGPLSFPDSDDGLLRKQLPDSKKVRIIKNGKKIPREYLDALINRHSDQKFSSFIRDVAHHFGYAANRNNPCKLYSLKGKKINSMSDFFHRNGHVFIAIGQDTLTKAQVRSIIEEVYPNSNLPDAYLREWKNGNNNNNNNNDNTNRSSDNPRDDDYELRVAMAEARAEQAEDELRRSKRQHLAVVPSIERVTTPTVINVIKPSRLDNHNIDINIPKKSPRNQVNHHQVVLPPIQQKTQHIYHINANDDTNEESDNVNIFINDEKQRAQYPSQYSGHEGNVIIHRHHTPSQPKVINHHINIDSNNDTMKTTTPNIIVHPSASGTHQLTEAAPQPRDIHINHSPSPRDNVVKIEHYHPDISNNISPINHHAINSPKKILDPNNKQISSVDDINDYYSIGKQLGDGNFAVVKYCTDRFNQNEYAMKIIDKKKMKGKEHFIQTEIELMKGCNHPNICRLYEHYEIGSEVYLLMELVSGGDLFDEISKVIKFSEHDSSTMIYDLTKALYYLHSRNIVHRDLKPENLLVLKKQDGRLGIKIADFGLAVLVKKPLNIVCGTPTYVAPEILQENGYGIPIDMWAVGVITYILLCGFPPFRSLDRVQDELFEVIKKGEFEYLEPYWDGKSIECRDLIDHLLVVDTGRRWKADDVLCHKWIQSEGGVLKGNFESRSRKSNSTKKMIPKCIYMLILVIILIQLNESTVNPKQTADFFKTYCSSKQNHFLENDMTKRTILDLWCREYLRRSQLIGDTFESRLTESSQNVPSVRDFFG
ncbi:hypothetical protein SNEBB_009536 [Seison nebaliae]|nr:hypothetical protein SNEBB_009536 [Seison nebaliae]